jgi:hypothetical protein
MAGRWLLLLALAVAQPNEPPKKTLGETLEERRRTAIGDVVEWRDPSVSGRLVGVVPTGTDGSQGLVWHRRPSWNPFRRSWNVRVIFPNAPDADYTMRSAYDPDHYYAMPAPEGTRRGLPGFLKPFTADFWEQPERDPTKPEYWEVKQQKLPAGAPLPGGPRGNVVPLMFRPKIDPTAEEPLAGSDLRQFLKVHFAPVPRKRNHYDTLLKRNPDR